jgi:arylsulfatase A-like enzyme
MFWKSTRAFYEEVARVPLIVSAPGCKPNTRHAKPVELVDIMPTLLELCGQPAHEGMQGFSLMPMLEGTAASPHNSVFCEYLNAMPWHKSPKAYASMVRTKEHKLVAAHSVQGGELYDLKNDPGEHLNLYNDPDYLGIKTELLEKLLYHWSCTADPLPQRKSDW